MKKLNFYAGPSILSEFTIKNTANAVLDFNGSGLSILEISHRSKEFQAVIDEANALTKELLDIPSGYEVLFLGGGASMQFCMVPFNLLNKKAAYIDTGVWAKKQSKRQNYSEKLTLSHLLKKQTIHLFQKNTTFQQMPTTCILQQTIQSTVPN